MLRIGKDSNSNDNSDGRPINRNADHQQRQPLEIYKVLIRSQTESEILGATTELIAQKLQLANIDLPAFAQIKHAAQSLKFKAKMLIAEYNEMCSTKTLIKETLNIFVSDTESNEKKQKQLKTLYGLAEKTINDVFSLQTTLLRLLEDNLKNHLKKLEEEHSPFAGKYSNAIAERNVISKKLILEFNKIYNQLRFLGKNPKDQESDQKTIDSILENYKSLLKQFKENILKIYDLTFISYDPQQLMILLTQTRDLFLAVAQQDNTCSTWQEAHQEYKTLLDSYRRQFVYEFGSDQEIQHALNAFFNKNDKTALSRLLTTHKDFVEFLGIYLPLCSNAAESWKKEKQIFSTLVDVKFDLDGIRMELARGLGKVHGESSSFPKIREFHSDDIVEIFKALANAISGMQIRLASDLNPRSKEWAYFKLLERYLTLTNQWISAFQPTAFDDAYKKHQKVLKQIEMRHFAGLREQDKQTAEVSSTKQFK